MKANLLQGVINLFLKEPNLIIYRKEPDFETHCNGRQDEEISRNCAPIIMSHNFSLPSPFPHLCCLIEAVFEFFRKD